MLTRRQALVTVAAAVAAACAPNSRAMFPHGGAASSSSGMTFDYYISPTGDDTLGNGTLESPWSITALNSKQSTYAGKSVGLIAGTYQYGTIDGVQTTLYSMMQALGSSTESWSILALQGGPSSSQPTYIASCNSAGVYSARGAIIDCSNPSGGALPTVSGVVLGQYYYMGTNVTQYGNVTVDGLVIRNSTFGALVFQGPSAGAISGLTIQNCELYDLQNVISNNNPGAIWLEYAEGALVQNCLIHDLQSNASGTSFSNQLMGYIQFSSGLTTPNTVKNCSFYNCSAVSSKDGFQGLNVEYCYLGWGTFGSGYERSDWSPVQYGATVQNYLTWSGNTALFHHNIVLGLVYSYGESADQPNQGVVKMYNNTFFQPTLSGASPLCAVTNNYDEYGATGTWQFYNNIVWANDGSYEDGDYAPAALDLGGATSSPSTVTACNNNAYGSGMTFNGSTSFSHVNFSTWQGYGFDANSVTLTESPFSGTPAEAEYETFAISSSSPAYTSGVSGAICGAVDGSGAVGCNFESIEGWPPA